MSSVCHRCGCAGERKRTYNFSRFACEAYWWDSRRVNSFVLDGDFQISNCSISRENLNRCSFSDPSRSMMDQRHLLNFEAFSYETVRRKPCKIHGRIRARSILGDQKWELMGNRHKFSFPFVLDVKVKGNHSEELGRKEVCVCVCVRVRAHAGCRSQVKSLASSR